MATVGFAEGRRCVIESVACGGIGPAETTAIEEAAGRMLAEPITADRDFPALSRSIRDGFAVRAADTPGRLRVAGEVRAGEVFHGQMRAGEAVEIMTGASLPEGADAVVMIEHVQREGESVAAPAAEPGQFVNPRGAEARQGKTVVVAGRRLGAAEIALAAATGRAFLPVWPRPRVAILATGDEVVPLDIEPAPHQVRNSNAYALAAQVRRAGGVASVLPIAPDEAAATRSLLERAFAEADLVLISGGVSAGKYDLVEPALAEMGAEFLFDRVRIQPGQPLVFGRLGPVGEKGEQTAIRGGWRQPPFFAGKPFFGLPGNPVSTLVTFELFARAALERLAGIPDPPLPLLMARLTTAFRHKPGLIRFLPAQLSADGSEVTPVAWHGSSDLAAVARGDSFLVAEEDEESWAAGDMMRVLVR